MPHREDHGVRPLERVGHIFLHAQLAEALLVAEEARQRVPGGGVALLLLELPPVLQVGVVHLDLRAHFGQLAHDDLRAAVARVAHVLAVGGPEQRHLGGGHDLAHVAQGVAHELGRVQAPGCR